MKWNNGIRGYIELLVTSVIWGITYVLMKFSLSYLDPQQIAFSRFLISSILFVPILVMIKERYSRKEIMQLVFLAVSGVLLYQLLFIYGEKGLSAGNASFIVSLEPIFIAILSIALGQERFSMILVLSLAVSTLGLGILVQPTEMKEAELVSMILVVLSALSWAVYTILGKDLLKRHNALNVTGFVSLFGLLLLFPFLGGSSAAIFRIHSTDLIISILFLGILATFVGYILWFDGLKYVRPTVAGTTLYITPFITVAFAAILIGEPMNLSMLVGGSLIVLGVAVYGIKRKS
jgi:drug/metabolite transporter (DMT)-like permease